MSMFKDSVILITGGTGSLGNKLTERLLKTNVKKIIIYSRNEMLQYNMKKKFNNDSRLRFLIGDVRDLDRLDMALKGVDYVIHASAMKHIDVCEYDPIEAIKTNINGAINVVKASINNNVKRVIALSTDKAVNATTLYGMTKAVSDKVFINGNVYSNSTIFSVVRYGNVSNSNGSVFPLWKSLLENDKDAVLPLTHSEMTRFYITLDRAVDLIFDSFTLMSGGEIFVAKLPSYKMTDVAKALDAKHEITGIRPSEKLAEQMITKEDSFVSKHNEIFIIYPDPAIMKKKYRYGDQLEQFIYSSDTNEDFLSVDDLREILGGSE